MPGYVMHLAEAELLFPILEERQGPLTDEWKNWFRLGSLLPDTKRRREKISSHFWNPAESRNLAIAPDLNRFLEKYESALKGPLMMGYFTHLHLDERFVHVFWKEQFAFLGDEGHPEEELEKIRKVRILRTGLEIPEELFFSVQYYYGDYSKMNDHFLRTYHLSCPEWRELDHCPVTEVNWADMHTVLDEIGKLIRGVYSFGTIDDLKVFDLTELENFIRKTAEEMADILPEFENHCTKM